MSGSYGVIIPANPYGVAIPAPSPGTKGDPVLDLFDTHAPDTEAPAPLTGPDSSQDYGPIRGSDGATWYAPTASPGNTPYAPIQGRAPDTPYAPIQGRAPDTPYAPIQGRAPSPPGSPPAPPASSGAAPTASSKGGLLGLDERTAKRDRRLGVKYYSDAAERRAKYQVEIGWRLKRRGTHFDSRELKERFAQKYQDRTDRELGMALLGRDRSGQPFPLPQDWVESGCIWVCVPDGRGGADFYSHVGKLRRFHHSSLIGGGGVICAGEWIVRNGSLLKISANSGHYRPPLSALHQAVLHLTMAHQVKTTVFLYDKQDDVWVDYPVSRFVANPSGNGRYTTHPDRPA